MADKHILHMLTPLRHMSPFDLNMALDAGFDAVLPYTEVKPEEVAGLEVAYLPHPIAGHS